VGAARGLDLANEDEQFVPDKAQTVVEGVLRLFAIGKGGIAGKNRREQGPRNQIKQKDWKIYYFGSIRTRGRFADKSAVF
jgi:hypothetical protein